MKNLTVRGDITPSGTQTQVGGIAGTNAGTIDNCAFSGIVMGGDYVGGIAGKNETGGTISLCQTSGVVRGTRFTGGIAGQNAGTVLNCTNKAAVNTAVSEEDLSSGLEDVESTIYTLLKREDVKENAVTTDTGGVAGYSNGILQSCTNLGAVGYPHVGYNVGGVCGLSLSSIRHSYAKCTLTGRKYVGGIVGSGSRVSDCLSMVAIADYTQLGGRRRNAPAGRGRGAAPAPPRRAEETDARRRISTPQKVEKQRQTGAAFLYDGCVSAVIVACGGVDHDEGDDLAVHLHIDLIDTALQLLIVIRRDVVVVQQALFKFRLPGVLIGVRIPGGIFRRCVRVSGGVCLLTGRVPLRRGGRGRYTAAAGKREHQQCRQQGGDDSVFHSHTPFIFVRRTSPVRPSDFPV